LFLKLLCAAFISLPVLSQVSKNFNKSSQPKFEVGVGAIGLSVPNYPGAGSNTIRYIPFPWIIYRSDFLHSDEEGTRAKLIRTKHFELGLSGGLNFPIDSNSNSAREGMPDTDMLIGIGPALIFRIIEGHDFHKLTAGLGVRINFSVDDNIGFTEQGWIVEPNIRYWAKLSDSVTFFTGLSYAYADKKYHSFFYEVHSEFVTPTRKLYSAKEGTVDIASSLGFSYDYSDKLSFFAGHFYSNLSTASNKGSPLVKNTHNDGYIVGMRWQFYESDMLAKRK
jgi:outer membrane scaffolding protein for murein synthesis (MipA/OmpV family)